jgi:hypothetical protein
MANEFGLGKASFCLLTSFTVLPVVCTGSRADTIRSTQEQPKSGDPNQEVLKISTEESSIPVFAFDGGGRFDRPSPLKIYSSGKMVVAQVVTGVYRVRLTLLWAGTLAAS